MELSSGYQQIPASVIPDDWSVVQLGDLGKWFSGGTPSIANSAYWKGNIPWVSPKDMKVSRLYEALDHVAEEAIGNGTRLLNPGALLMVVRGMILAHSFPVARAERAVAFNQDLKALVTRDDIDSNFVLYWLVSHEQQLRSLATESTHGTKRLPTESLLRAECVVPPLLEQHAIAGTLGDVDALLRALDRLIAKKRDLKQAAMQQLIAGETRLPGFAGAWNTVLLGDVADVKTGPFGSSLHERDYVQDGTPIITVEHLGEFGVIHRGLPKVSSSDRHRLRAYTLQRGDIVFSRVGSVDRNALIGEAEVGWLFSGRLLRVRPHDKKAVAPYLSYQFNGESFKQRVRSVAVGQTMASLNTRILRHIPIVLPDPPEQRAIAAVLSDIDTEIAALEQRLTKTRALKQGMMQELLTGRTRLV